MFNKMRKLVLLAGRANENLASRIGSVMGVEPGERTLEDFPDRELHVELHVDVGGCDVYIVQPTPPPVGSHLLELMLLADGCIRAGAARITGIIPYFGYARQDRRVRSGEPVGARLFADLMGTRLDRVVVMDLHNAAVEGFFSIPVEHLSGVPLLAEAIRPALSGNHLLVAPDLGAVKLTHRYADLLDLPVAYIHKERASGVKVRTRRVIGEVKGKAPVVVDDMISTGGTIRSALETLLDVGCLPDLTVVATHGLFVEDALVHLSPLPIRKILVTDSVPQTHGPKGPPDVASISNLLAETIKRVHEAFG
jgi:ribose-phosphate pyrophosphokinase